MISYNYVTKENVEEHNTYWPQIPDHQYRILIIEDPGSEKTMHYLIWSNKKIMMILALLIKFIYMLRIQMKQSVNILLKNVKKWI